MQFKVKSIRYQFDLLFSPSCVAQNRGVSGQSHVPFAHNGVAYKRYASSIPPASNVRLHFESNLINSCEYKLDMIRYECGKDVCAMCFVVLDAILHCVQGESVGEPLRGHESQQGEGPRGRLHVRSGMVPRCHQAAHTSKGQGGPPGLHRVRPS